MFGSFNFKVNIMLANYTGVTLISISYRFNLKPCIVKTILPSTLSTNAIIQIGAGTNMVNLPDFVLDPNCGYKLESFLVVGDTEIVSSFPS